MTLFECFVAQFLVMLTGICVFAIFHKLGLPSETATLGQSIAIHAGAAAIAVVIIVAFSLLYRRHRANAAIWRQVKDNAEAVWF